MRGKRSVLLTVVVVALLVPGVAEARSLSLPAARAVVARSLPRVTTIHCWRLSHSEARCSVTGPAEEQPEVGWTETSEVAVHLHHHSITVDVVGYVGSWRYKTG